MRHEIGFTLRTFRITWYWQDDPDQIVQEMYYQATSLTEARKDAAKLLRKLHPHSKAVKVHAYLK